MDVFWNFLKKAVYTSSQDPIAGGEEEVNAAFHAITGCDTTSQFVGIGKQKRGEPSRVVQRSCLSTLAKKATLMLTYLQMLRHLCASFTIRAQKKFTAIK